MKKSRIRLAVPLALVGAAVAAAPASAATAPMAAGGSFARTAPFIDGSIYAYECHAVAPGALSTTISSCTLKASDGGSIPAAPSTSPGPVAATSGAVSSNVSLTYQVCWTASATYADGSSQSTSGCSSSSSIAGTGVSRTG